mmetsp:Transcript_1994/g.4470  ORF Transcript_1994/g.4470 Transcript_1994/m.4470 type:complete len:277 (-) Transcript_1994:20-850(-)
MSQLNESLSLILKPELVKALSNWPSSASPDEIKGLKVITAVINHKGQKKFRSKPTTLHSDLPTLAEVAADRRKKQLQSTYEANFSSSRDSEQKSAVLRYRRLSDLPCSTVLNPISLKFLEAWISLKDDTSYQELMLICLRSLAASINTERQAVTEQKKQYVWNDPSRILKAHRVDNVAQQLRSKSSATQRPWIRPQTPKKTDMSIDVKVFSKLDLDRMKQALIRGSGAITSWMGAPMKQVSAYQDTYVTHFTRYHQPPPMDFYTSISLGRLIPTNK